VASLIIVIRAVLGVVYQIYRGQDRAVAYSIAQLATRYAPLAMAIAILLAYGLTAYEVIVATAVGEGLVVIVCLAEFAARGILGRPTLSRWHVNAAFSYGAPLAVGTYATFLLDYGDRFLIERFLGLDAVATYAVPYDLVSMLAATVFGSVKLALLPIIFRLWESDGRAVTSDFVSQVFTYSVALAIPGAVLFVAVSGDLIVLLTSAKYSGSAALTAYLLPGVFMGEMNFLLASGLLVNGSTGALALLSLSSGVVNIVLNLVLLPRWGLVGAASATTMAYALLMLGTYFMSRRALELHIKPLTLAVSLLATAVMMISLRMVGQISTQPALNLFVRGTIGAVIAGLCMSVLDRKIREQTWLRGARSLRLNLAS
jgi:O-antigen/teichoic acid export membrane protein